jgi:hypothetical protein
MNEQEQKEFDKKKEKGRKKREPKDLKENPWFKFKLKIAKKIGPISPMKVTIFVAFLALVITEIWTTYKNSEKVYGDISVQEVYDMVDAGEVESITVNRENL